MRSQRGFSILPLVLVLAPMGLPGQPIEPAIGNWPAPPMWQPPAAGRLKDGENQRNRPEGMESLPSAPLPFVGITPCRVVDTRLVGGAYGAPSLTAGVPRNFNIPLGPCSGIPPTAGAFSLNVTVTNTQGPGFILIYPQDAPQPLVSTLNYIANETVANAAIVPAGTGGGITVIAGVSGTDLVIDINGYYSGTFVTSLTAQAGLTASPATGAVIVGISDGGVDTAQLADGAVTTPKLAPNAVILAGEVTGAQATTVVSAASPANTPGAIVRRNGSGDFSAHSITLSGNLALPMTACEPGCLGYVGMLTVGGVRFLHDFGTDSTFAGANAGNVQIGGSGNTGIGSLALQNVGATSNNSALGYSALSTNTTGRDNTAIGALALQHNLDTHANTAVGARALQLNEGAGNTAVGSDALPSNGTGAGNTALGSATLVENTTGSGNTAVGDGSLYFNTGEQNTGLGANSLIGNTIGSRNIGIGLGAGSNLTTGDDNIEIASAGIAGEARTIRIGTVQNRVFVAGIRGVTTGTADTLPVMIDSNGQLGTVSSSIREKRGVVEIGESSAAVLQLRPVSFLYKDDASEVRQYGLIAEEVAQVLPDLVQCSPAGEPETVKYHFLPALLLSALRKQHQAIEEQGRTIVQQRIQLDALADRLSKLERQLERSVR